MTIELAWHWWMLPLAITAAAFAAAYLIPAGEGEYSSIRKLGQYAVAAIAAAGMWAIYGIAEWARSA